MAAPLYELVSKVPDNLVKPELLDRQIDGWEAWRDAAGEVQAYFTGVNTFTAVSTAVANTCSGTVMFHSSSLPSSVQLVVETAQEKASAFWVDEYRRGPRG